MIITIDTSKDSYQDIKKLIKFLQHHVGDHSAYNTLPETTNNDFPSPSAGMFGMFDNDSQLAQDPYSNTESLLKDEEEPKEDIEIMPY